MAPERPTHSPGARGQPGRLSESAGTWIRRIDGRVVLRVTTARALSREVASMGIPLKHQISWSHHVSATARRPS
eukprot:6105178-Prymnesium_polylepis.1